MLDSIVVRTADLLEIAQQLVDDGASCVRISLMDADLSDPGAPIPPGVHFSGYIPGDDDADWDYGVIDAVP